MKFEKAEPTAPIFGAKPDKFPERNSGVEVFRSFPRLHPIHGQE